MDILESLLRSFDPNVVSGAVLILMLFLQKLISHIIVIILQDGILD